MPVRFLEKERASGLERGDELLEDVLPLRDVQQRPPAVHEVECALGESGVENVLFARLEIRVW
jgi:hypothetical protein